MEIFTTAPSEEGGYLTTKNQLSLSVASQNYSQNNGFQPRFIQASDDAGSFHSTHAENIP